MSNTVLPKIKVIGAPSLEGSSTVAASLSPSSTTDGGQSGGPRSPSSSEGVSQESLHWIAIFSSRVVLKLAPFPWFPLVVVPMLTRVHGRKYTILECHEQEAAAQGQEFP
jgi:hypothetical protein